MVVAVVATFSAGVTYAAGGSKDRTVTLCADTRTHAVTIAGKCAKHDRSYTVNKTGPRGPRGVAGPGGVTHALFDSNGFVSLPPGTRESGVLVDPGTAAAATLARIPAGTYLVSATSTLETADDGTGLYACSTLFSQASGKPAGTNGAWEAALGNNQGTGTPVQGEVTFTFTGEVTFECENFNTGSNIATLNFSAISLVPVDKLTVTTG